MREVEWYFGNAYPSSYDEIFGKGNFVENNYKRNLKEYTVTAPDGTETKHTAFEAREFVLSKFSTKVVPISMARPVKQYFDEEHRAWSVEYKKDNDVLAACESKRHHQRLVLRDLLEKDLIEHIAKGDTTYHDAVFSKALEMAEECGYKHLIRLYALAHSLAVALNK